MPLQNRQHELFAQEYAVSYNCRKAAVAVGLAAGSGSRLMQRKDIQERVEQLADSAFTAANIDAFRVIRELARIAFADPRALYDEFGNLIPVHELDDDTAAIIAGVKVSIEGGRRGRLKRGNADEGNEEGSDDEIVVTKDIKLVGKNEALLVLAKHFKLVGEDADGVNALANALADRLNNAKRRDNARAAADAEDATYPGGGGGGGGPRATPGSMQRSAGGMLSYGMDDEPSSATDVTSPRLQAAKFDEESLHFDLPGVEVAPDPEPAANGIRTTPRQTKRTSVPQSTPGNFAVRPSLPPAAASNDDFEI